MTILVTGAAGFIGFHLCLKLMEQGRQILGLDNLNTYYPVQLKQDRLARLQQHEEFRFVRMDLADRPGMQALFEQESLEGIVHLAAQAGVRYSLKAPLEYIDSNLMGFGHILEGARRQKVKHLVYASSSSVYGANSRTPFSTRDGVAHPVSLYAATKRANELMAHAYSHLYALPTTGLRFFTVYGPWGRPDMAYYSFTQRILAGQPIQIFNNGQHRRDFTYIDDIIEGVVRILARPPTGDPQWDPAQPHPDASAAPFALYNIGNHRSIPLMTFIETLEHCLGRTAIKEYLPFQPGDVEATHANIEPLRQQVGFAPDTPLEKGLAHFVRWYHDYHGGSA